MAADRIRVICGPTGAGKSQIALALALEHTATIINADSRQIYRGFDIGTAKPDWTERRMVPHEGIDIADPSERYSASRWSNAAADWIAVCRAGGRIPLVVGGTGFYVSALVTPLFDGPVLDAAPRSELETFLATLAVEELRRWCIVLDPSRAHLGRAQLTRAIETALLAGRRISEMHAGGRPSPRFAPRYLVVDPGPALASRIEQRVDRMLDSGWTDEVRVLLATVAPNAPAWKASGYGMVRQLVAGETSLSSARDRIIIETRQYAKRQRTWFRHQLGTAQVTRVNPDDPECMTVVERWWKESS